MYTRNVNYSDYKFKDELIYFNIHTGDNGARKQLMSWGMKDTKVMRNKNYRGG
jgi:hypothetical protein